MRVESGQVQNVNVSNIAKRKADEEKRLREMTIPKKHKRLYDQIKYTQKKKRQEVNSFLKIKCFDYFFILIIQVEKLKRKRADYENNTKQTSTTEKKKKQIKSS